MEVDGPADVKNELPTPPASDVGSPTSFSHCGSDSEPDSPMGEDTKVRRPGPRPSIKLHFISRIQRLLSQ